MSEIQTPIQITDVRTETAKLLSASLAPPYRLLLAWLLEGMDVVKAGDDDSYITALEVERDGLKEKIEELNRELVNERSKRESATKIALTSGVGAKTAEDQIRSLTADLDAVQSDLSDAHDSLDQIAALLGLNPDETDCPTLIQHVKGLSEIAKAIKVECQPAAEKAKEMIRVEKPPANRVEPPAKAEQGQRATGEELAARASKPEAPADPARGAVVACAPKPSGSAKTKRAEKKLTPNQIQMAVGLFARGFRSLEVAARVEGMTIEEASTLSMWHEKEIAEATKAFGDGDEKTLGIYLAGFLKGLVEETKELVAA